ncbi:thermonuclease family protein [Sulfurospirillum arcachonense]|uniref:thermonuclease family protein n=1 Tax=Sulfurospirillum arcachonense TaxID=57666 RepID=UPI00046866BE|nr:thermonuclease family protein [Sulfurospirillum arcachonense]
MFKFLFFFIFPLFLYAKSGTLVRIVDADTIILKDGMEFTTCHMGDIDALESVVNKKLKKEIDECGFSKKEFLSAGSLSYEHAKTLLKLERKYDYKIVRYFSNKYPVCKLILPKGLHVELHPNFDEIMVERGFALPYIIHSDETAKKILLKVASEAKIQKRGLWKSHPHIMKCLVKHRYSLRSLR